MSRITLTWNEDVRLPTLGGAHILLTDSGSNIAALVSKSQMSVDPSSTSTLHINFPTGTTLQERMTYTVVTASNVDGLVEDIGGAANKHEGMCGSAGLESTSCLDGQSSPTKYTFTIEDATPPHPMRDSAVLPLYGCAQNPQTSTLNFTKGTSLYIRFHEEITLINPLADVQIIPSKSKGVLQTVANNGEDAVAITIPTPGVAPVRVELKSGVTDTILITIDASDGALVDSQWYDVILPAGLVQDTVGNENIEVASGTFCFRMADATPPFIISYSPELNEVGVGVAGSVFMRLGFNEPITTSQYVPSLIYPGSPGTFYGTIYGFSTTPAVVSIEDCAALCVADSTCQGIAFGNSMGISTPVGVSDGLYQGQCSFTADLTDGGGMQNPRWSVYSIAVGSVGSTTLVLTPSGGDGAAGPVLTIQPTAMSTETDASGFKTVLVAPIPTGAPSCPCHDHNA